MSTGKGDTNLTVHDDATEGKRDGEGDARVHRAHEERPKPSGSASRSGPSTSATAVVGARSSAMAERSLRERRRERDRRAERTALAVVTLVFLGIGTGGYYVLSSGLLDGGSDAAADDGSLAATSGRTEPALRPPPVERRSVSAAIDETPDLPAIRMMGGDGLTVAAEGIPEVTSDDTRPAAGVAAAIETCRFAYGVWEFSPNKRFRFMTTCGPMAGQILVGAYEIQGSRLRLSPLVDGAVTLVSEFEVEKPSKMLTHVKVGSPERPILLEVTQRITTIRAGLEGEAFRATYAPRNTLQPPGVRAPSERGSLADQLQ